MGSLVPLLLAAFAFSATTGYLCRRLALRVGAISAPRQDCWNSEPVPLLGGFALVAGTGLGLLFVPSVPSNVWVLLVGSIGLATVGLVDDLRSLSAASKLTFQLIAAAAVTGLGLRFELTGVPAVDIIVTVVWLVALTNAFNLLDNMDGLAAGIAAIAGVFKLALCAVDGDWACAGVMAVFVGACLGFLVHNRAPARLFMGDAGSLFLGFFVAGLATIGVGPDSRATASVLIVPVVIMLVPIFDTVFVTVVRLVSRRPIAQGGRDHTSHRLVTAGLSERQAVVAFYVLAAMAGGLAFATRDSGFFVGIAMLAGLGIAMLILGVGLARVRVQFPDEAATTDGLRLPFGFAAVSVRQFATTGIQAVLVLLAFWSAYAFRYGSAAGLTNETFLQALPLVFASKMLALVLFQTYRTVWRYTDSRDLLALVQASVAGSLMSVAAVEALYGIPAGELRVFGLDWLLLTSMLAGARLSLRALTEILKPLPPPADRVLIYGAGDTGVSLARELGNHQAFERTAVGFIDDDVFRRNVKIRGLPVFGGHEKLEAVLTLNQIDEVIIATAGISPERLRHVQQVAERLGVPVTRCSLSPSGFLIKTDVA